MRAARRRRRTQRLLLLAALGVAAYAWFVYQPLSQQGAELDEPLIEIWKELADVNWTAPTDTGDQLPQIDAALQHVQDLLDALAQSQAELLARIDPGSDLRARIQAPFQLVEFQNERLLIAEQLSRLAQQRKVTLDPGLAGGFPEYIIDRPQPALLWAQLNLLRHTLTSAVNSGFSVIQSTRSPTILFLQGNPSDRELLVEIPLELEAVGSAAAAARFLKTVPLRSGEIEEQGLPEAGPDKPAYFIKRLFLRKESRERLDDVRLKLTISSLIYLNTD